MGLTQHIGDLVAAEPVSRFLAKRDGRRIVWAARRDLAMIAGCFPAVDATLRLDSLTEWAGLARTAGRGAVDLHVGGSWCDRHLYRHARPGCAATREDYYANGPLLSAFARAGGLPPPGEWGIDLTPRLTLPPPALAAADALGLPPRFVAFHCASNQASRDWRGDRWRRLAARVIDRHDLPVIEIGLSPILRGVPGVVNACGRLGVLGTAAAIARSALFVGIDSGPAHFANALGPPGVILLGRYGPFARYTPYSGRYAEGGATVIHHDGPVAELPVEDAYAAVAERLRSEEPRHGVP